MHESSFFLIFQQQTPFVLAANWTSALAVAVSLALAWLGQINFVLAHFDKLKPQSQQLDGLTTAPFKYAQAAQINEWCRSWRGPQIICKVTTNKYSMAVTLIFKQCKGQGPQS